jgi:small subunit ribosomal protein S21
LITVTVKKDEPFERALRRFKRKVEQAGIKKEIKRKMFYIKPGEARRKKQREALRRRRKQERHR